MSTELTTYYSQNMQDNSTLVLSLARLASRFNSLHSPPIAILLYSSNYLATNPLSLGHSVPLKITGHKGGVGNFSLSVVIVQDQSYEFKFTWLVIQAFINVLGCCS